MYLLENVIENIKTEIKSIINNTQIENFDVEIPADENHGDLSSNVALLSAKYLKMSPRTIAENIASKLNSKIKFVDKIEVAGPGFINFFLSKDFFSDSLKEIKSYGENYGKSKMGNGKKVMIEFVSANPTGPMHMGNARLGALGDCLAEVLNACGYNTYKEFYVNDAGNQIEKFGMSLDVRYKQICLGESSAEMPENAYHGEDIKELAHEFFDIHKDKFISSDEKTRIKALVDFALPKNIKRMQDDMKKYKIIYDNWFYESDLHNQGKVKEIVDLLSSKGLTYEKDGSIWYKASMFGNEKDEVLIRSNGIPTYFAADIAYHYNKFAGRKFDTCIDIWGADHHGHVERMKCSMEALGINRNRLHVILVQLVRLIKDGEPYRMSKRSGKSVQLSDLINEVGADAARFIFNTHEASSGMDFDLDLAISKDFQNPVYYVQYAYARICSIFKSVEKEKYSFSGENLNLLTHESEKKLIYYMSLYPSELVRAAKNYDPTKITRFVISLAGLFHKFYSSCKVISENKNLSEARLFLCDCVRIMIKNILDMMKVESPEFMQQ